MITPAHKVNHPSCPGVTLVEVLVAVVILAVVITMSTFYFAGLETRGEVVKCMSNLKSLHVALNAQFQDTQRWPQVPENLDDDGYALFWRRTLAPYGADEGVWRCPTAKRTVERSPAEEKIEIDYACAEFDDSDFAPFEESRQPWVVESGDFHGEGNLLITTGGSVHSFNSFYRNQTGQDPPWLGK